MKRLLFLTFMFVFYSSAMEDNNLVDHHLDPSGKYFFVNGRQIYIKYVNGKPYYSFGPRRGLNPASKQRIYMLQDKNLEIFNQPTHTIVEHLDSSRDYKEKMVDPSKDAEVETLLDVALWTAANYPAEPRDVKTPNAFPETRQAQTDVKKSEVPSDPLPSQYRLPLHITLRPGGGIQEHYPQD